MLKVHRQHRALGALGLALMVVSAFTLAVAVAVLLSTAG